MHPRPPANHLAAVFRTNTSRANFSAIASFVGNHQLPIIQQLISHQAFSFPGLIRSNVQKLRDRQSNVLYAYILKLFAGFKIFSLDDERYGHILRRIGAVRSVMTAVVRSNYDSKIIRKRVHNPVTFRQPELIKLSFYTSLRQNPQRRFYRMRQRRCCSLKAAYHCHLQALSPSLKKDLAISKIARSGFRYEPMIAFRDRYLNSRTCSFQSSSEQNTSASIRFCTVPKAPAKAPVQSGSGRARDTSLSLRSVPLRLQREWFLSHSSQDRLPGTGMHLPPPAARPCGRAESEHIRVSPSPPAGWQPCPFW